MGWFIDSAIQSKPLKSGSFDCWWLLNRDGTPKHSVVAIASSCFRSHRRRPTACPHSRLPQTETYLGGGFPAIAADMTPDSGALRAPEGSLDLSAAQADAEGASQTESIHGNLEGSSLRSTAPRRLVRVHRLQSYSKDAQAMRTSRSCAAQAIHSA